MYNKFFFGCDARTQVYLILRYKILYIINVPIYVIHYHTPRNRVLQTGRIYFILNIYYIVYVFNNYNKINYRLLSVIIVKKKMRFLLIVVCNNSYANDDDNNDDKNNNNNNNIPIVRALRIGFRTRTRPTCQSHVGLLVEIYHVYYTGI